MASSGTSLWDILQEISSKKEWYRKIFDQELVQKWREEHSSYETSKEPGSFADIFWLAIKTLRASAKGTQLSPHDCSWEDKHMCDSCLKKAKEEIRLDPAKYGLEADEIDGYLADDDWPYYFNEYGEYCQHPRCKCVGPDSKLSDYVEYQPVGLLSVELIQKLKTGINKMRAENPVDWHPGSYQQVRDIVHPSLYCYVRGKSKLADGHADKIKHDENVRYQWLPAEIEISPSGQVKFGSYINSLTHPEMVPLLAQTLTSFLPSFERVLHKSLKGKSCQVIVKIGSIHLEKNKSKYGGGSWHIEGMPYERIVATGLHYLEVENVTESFLEFRKPVVLNEEDLDYPQNDGRYTTHHYGLEPGSHNDGQMNRYLGAIKAGQGASVVFPNTLQHRVKEFEMSKDSGLRTIVAFFLIDPERRIISTKDVPPQQQIFSWVEAETFRQQLMFHRKYFVDRLNKRVYERPYSLCEH